MFSLRETDDGKFIYRCHACGWEYELMATDQAIAVDQAVAYTQSHKCAAHSSFPVNIRELRRQVNHSLGVPGKAECDVC